MFILGLLHLFFFLLILFPNQLRQQKYTYEVVILILGVQQPFLAMQFSTCVNAGRPRPSGHFEHDVSHPHPPQQPHPVRKGKLVFL